MNVPILSIGIACIIAAIVGGGMKALGAEIPTIASTRRQAILGIFGAALVLLAFNFDRMAQKPADSSKIAAPISSVDSNLSQKAAEPVLPKSEPSTPPISQKAAIQTQPNMSKALLQSQNPTPSATANTNPAPPAPVKKTAPSLKKPDPNLPLWVDSATGLMWWKVQARTPVSAAEAAKFCEKNTFYTDSDWRLPSYLQLEHLFRQKRAEAEIAHKNQTIWMTNTLSSIDGGEISYSSVFSVPAGFYSGDVQILLCVRDHVF